MGRYDSMCTECEKYACVCGVNQACPPAAELRFASGSHAGQPMFAGQHSMKGQQVDRPFGTRRGDAGLLAPAPKVGQGPGQTAPADAPEWRCGSCGGDSLWCGCPRPAVSGFQESLLRERGPAETCDELLSRAMDASDKVDTQVEHMQSARPWNSHQVHHQDLYREAEAVLPAGIVPGIAGATSGPIVKDSGKREHFTSGMQRDTQEGKPRWDLAMDGPMLRELYHNDGAALAMFRWYDSGELRAADLLVRYIGGSNMDALLTDYAILMAEGALKYTERNWMQAAGQPELARFRASACRHFWQWRFGYKDERHNAAVLFNLNGFHYVQQRLRDRQANCGQAA